MSFSRRLFWMLPALCFGCGSQDEPPPSFSVDAPHYFSRLDLLSEDNRAAFPEFEKRWDKIAQDTLARIDQGEVVEEKETQQAARALFYAANALLAGQYAVEDGFLKLADVTRPPRYSKGDDADEQRARLVTAQKWFKQAEELDASDERIGTGLRACAFGQQTLDGTYTADVLLGLNSAASQTWFDTYSALHLTRDPKLHPGYAPHIEQLISTVCKSDRLDCTTGPKPLPSSGEKELAKHVVAPLWLSDLLMKRGEAQVIRADLNPAQAGTLLPEAVDRFRLAEKYLSAAKQAADNAALSHFPAKHRLAGRSERLAALTEAANERLKTGSGPDLPDAGFFASPAYLDAYQCVACHK
jgi:hypothetical protein